jgi:YegS/Rv2252/BmrU family lipid kinase
MTDTDLHYLNNNRTVLILNPKAGRENLNFISKNLHKYRDHFDYTTFYSIDECRSFIRENLDKYDIFVAVGGDGTASSMAAELTGTDKLLAIFPIGSGNGFAREMGFTRNFEDLIKDIERKETFYIDVLYLNNTPCINIAGAGIDSYVAHEFHNLIRRGFWKYVYTSLKVMARIKPFRFVVNIDSRTVDEHAFMVTLANTRQFGNNALIAPMAKPDDGKFNIVVVRPFPKILAPLFAVRLITGSLKESRYVTFLESEDSATFISREKRFHIDGEPIIIDGKVRVEIRKKVLGVLRSGNNRW